MLVRILARDPALVIAEAGLEAGTRKRRGGEAGCRGRYRVECTVTVTPTEFRKSLPLQRFDEERPIIFRRPFLGHTFTVHLSK